mmetsp:Transcript_35269/g.70054  ORF Transcript_35269/g.70054 Transcript_35269/m.70054 type:complete len:215 (-) Transcript_35269:567-1211(-)
MARHDAHVGSSLWPDGAELVLAVAWVRADRHGFGHGISRHDGDLHHFLQLLGDRWHQRGGAISDELQGVLGLLRAHFLRVVQHLEMHRRHRRIPSRLRLRLQRPVKSLDRKDAGHANDLRTGHSRRQHIDDQAVDVEEGHGVIAHILLLHLHSRSDAEGSASDVRMRQWDDLGLLRGAGGVQHERQILAFHGRQRIAQRIALQWSPRRVLFQRE